MLYIFHVDTGRMLTFDMSLALESVHTLKETIERLHDLPVANQVLLISGGEILQLNSRVCSYSSGMDTNPIYMFITNFSESKCALQPWPSIEHQEIDFEKLVRQSIALPATYNTVVSRAQLAQNFHESAREEFKICEKLVYEQHLQQQGWAAVIANLEDLTNEFRQRFEDFCRCFDEFLEKKEHYLELLNNFDSDLKQLANVPILPGLISSAQQEFHGFDEYLNENESFTVSLPRQNEDAEHDSASDINNEINYSCCGQKSKSLTLLQWITAKETHKSFENLSVNCLKQLQSFQNDKIFSLRTQIQKTIENAEKEDVREIKGLKDRLQGLDKLMVDVKNKVQDQNELATAFQQNQNRASNLGDASILPDLCETHSSQLYVMHKNHMYLRDIRRRISKAKEELGSNVMQRLKFIGHIENKMSELDNQMLFSHRCLRRFQRHLVIIEQIHFAPIIYVTAVAEVVRRRTFSNLFLEWATKLSMQLQFIYADEVMRRQQFETLFDGHFLNCLFSGMDDMPPSYGTQAPKTFDSSLPNLTKEDLLVLSTLLPDISAKISLPDLSTVIDFFMSSSGNTNKTIKKTSPQEIETTNRILGILDVRSRFKDEFESETDTDEFEKVGQCSMERGQLSILKQDENTNETEHPETQNALSKNVGTSTESIPTHCIETLTEENLFSTRVETDRLKTLLRTMFEISNSTISLLRQELQEMKKTHECDQSNVKTTIDAVTETWEKMKNEIQVHEREMINQLTVDHELELNDIRKHLDVKNDEIESYKNEIKGLLTTIAKLTGDHEMQIISLAANESEHKKKIVALETQLSTIQADKERELNELMTNLTREHKTEIEALRCRFKLMTNMERSPSDTSLEKIERIDVIDLISHDSILMQTREDLEYEREIAIKEAVERERAKWERCYSSPQKSPPIIMNEDLYKEILQEKEEQLDMIKEREQILLKENTRYKETIQKLTDADPSENLILKNQIDQLYQAKIKLEELNAERSKRIEMESSFTADKSLLSTTSKPSDSSGNSRSKTHSSKNRVILEGCIEGDIVVIVWDPDHRQYVIVQDASILYFLHELSHKCLNLTYPTGDDFMPNKLHCIARVINKEYCHAKKDDNRYKVSKGTKFYRIKAVPVTPTKHLESNKSNTKRERCGERVQGTKITPSHLLIDSFAQTDCLVSSIMVADKTMVDSGVVAHQKSSYKERNISLTEDDELAITSQDQYRPCEEECIDMGNQIIEVTTTILQPSPNLISTDIEQNDSDEYRSLQSADFSENMPFTS